MNSIQVPDFYEEELNLVPTHTVGVAAYGEFSLKNGHRIHYIGSVGNGRPGAPDGAVYARDPSRSKEVTGLVEWLIPGYKDSRVGFSGWHGAIDTVQVDALGQTVDVETAGSLQMRERGLDVFVVINSRRIGLNAEYVHSRQEDVRNPGTPAFTVKGGLAELSVNFLDGKLHPFLRYDRTSVPDGGGPYLSLREEGGQFSRVYVPEFEALMTGAALDVNAHLRLKVELIRHLDGPRKKNGVAFQSAFGF